MDNLKEKIDSSLLLSRDEENNIAKEMKEAYLNCPKAIAFLSSLNVPETAIDESIDKVFDMVRDINYCEHCPGLENCAKENQHVFTSLTYQHGYLERKLSPCEKMLERIDMLSQFIYHDYDEEWLNYDIKSMDKFTNRTTILGKYVNYIQDTSDEWIFINGAPNSGRSFIAAMMANDLAKKKHGPIAFINAPQRIKFLYDLSFNNKNRFNQIINNLSECLVLIIDDFGNEYKNDFIRDGIILPILSKRSGKKYLTIFTSDYTINDISNMYQINASTNSKMAAKRLKDILLKECKKEITLSEISLYR